MIVAHAYRPDYADRWNRAVRTSRNGTFLFDRGFMDYHADRFTDASFLFERDGAVLALLPQTLHGDEWRSHGGLTYGGLVLSAEANVIDVGEIIDQVETLAHQCGVARQRITPVPHVYHVYPCDEERYCLFHAGAQLVGTKVDSAILLDQPLPERATRRKGARKAERAGLSIDRLADPTEFHPILIYNRRTRHGVEPVHSAQEMALLQNRFPDHIRCWMVRDAAGRPVAGAWIFETRRCAHIQYAAYDDRGQELRATDFLYLELIAHYRDRKACLTFGVSDDSKGLNAGLVWQKATFGARAIVHETFERRFQGAERNAG